MHLYIIVHIVINLPTPNTTLNTYNRYFKTSIPPLSILTIGIYEMLKKYP